MNGDTAVLTIMEDGRRYLYDPAVFRAVCAHELFSEERNMTPEEIKDVTLTALKPILVTACVVARYFNRDEQKPERVKNAVLDVELILKELGLADVTKAPVAK